MTVRQRVNEGASQVIEFDIDHDDFSASPAPTLTSATLTLFDYETYSPDVSPLLGIINSRNAQDVLNTNDVDIDSNGHVTWTVQPEDNVIVTTRRQVERHIAQFAFEWAGGAYTYEFEIEVVNLRSES